MENFQSLLILMVTVWVAGKLFRAMRLPVIFGELLGGVIVGPMVLGLIDPGSHTVELLAELGIFFLMFHSGLEADPHELAKASKKSFLIAAGGILLPFIGGYFIASAFGQSMVPALYIALCVSVTAIPITARLLKDYKIQRSNAAHVTIGAAILNDIMAFILFSIIMSLHANGDIQPSQIFWLVAQVGLFFGIVMWLGFKLSKHMGKALQNKGFTFALIVALGLGLLAESIGLHMILGAFLAGLFIREEVLDDKIFTKIEDRIYGLSYGFLGPIFFASLAFNIDFSALFTQPLFLVALIAVAVVGKMIGAGGGALIQKMKSKEALLIAVAMNARGAMELVLASIGYEAGILDQSSLSILVIMAFVTTLVTIIAMKPVIQSIRAKS